jgi:hypothetical protein
MDWPSEHRILKSRKGRTLVAAAYFDGISRYLAARYHGLRYQVLSAPAEVAPEATMQAKLWLTNRGHSTSSGWRLVARVVPAVRRYDGRPRRGAVVARTPVPDGLGPGESVELTISDIPMPAAVGTWLVKLDVNLPGGDAMSKHGVVGPQLRVKTVAPSV